MTLRQQLAELERRIVAFHAPGESLATDAELTALIAQLRLMEKALRTVHADSRAEYLFTETQEVVSAALRALDEEKA